MDVTILDDGWMPIATLPPRQRVIVGRWHKFGKDPQDWAWEQYEGHWFVWHNEHHWSWGDQCPFTGKHDPTHWHLPIAPPPPPVD